MIPIAPPSLYAAEGVVIHTEDGSGRERSGPNELARRSRHRFCNSLPRALHAPPAHDL